ncbi:polymorphic toxin-type HINT domain-containing protein [Nocardiopsis sp. NPDC101807]|uniref:polymorphic toxin-type HINT domain-containing protein n=1 Tax=Nocardiopsis sp. NPDC101807 TaxID=3364339 RepID=UPI00380B7BE9
MADGSARPVEEDDVGEKVLATDPETGERTARTVLAKIIGSGAKHLVQITVDPTTERDAVGEDAGSDNAGEQAEQSGIPGPVAVGDVIIATDGHPFWVPDLEQWVDAVDLASGTWLQTSSGTWVQVSAVQAWTQAATVHNLTVQGVHTFHVAAGDLSVLNHNCGGGTTVYRGVSERSGQTGDMNPAFEDATNGVVNPRGGSATPESHHNSKTNSEYTSWTTSPRVALTAATKDGGAGVVVRSRIPSGRVHVHSNEQPWVEFRGSMK